MSAIRRRRFFRALAASGKSDLAVANALGFASSNITRLRYTNLEPSLFTACLLVAAFDGQVDFEDFLSAAEARKVESVRGLFVADRKARAA